MIIYKDGKYIKNPLEYLKTCSGFIIWWTGYYMKGKGVATIVLNDVIGKRIFYD